MPLFRTLHGRLSAFLFVLFLLIALLYVPLALFTARRYLQEVNQRHNYALATNLATYLADKNLLRDSARARARAKNEIKHLMVINPNVEVYLLDAGGGIVAYSDAPGRVQRARVRLEPLQQFLRAGTGAPLPILGEDPRDPGGHKVFSVAPIKERGGYVYIILDGREHTSVAQLLQRSYIARLGAVGVAGSLFFVLGAGLYGFTVLTRRLRGLTTAMEGFQQRNLHTASDLSPRPRDEIDRLGTVFEQMVMRIDDQVQALQKSDQQRREMVSNVSHDLRTPLAALRGYLETLLIKEELPPGEQKRYLNIAVQHSERLGHLVSELFELASLDSREVPVRAEPFSLGELVQDVTQKYQLVAENKNLRLRADFEGEPPFVFADIALIERVLENLLENAVRYTPEGGVVTVRLSPERERVVVSVQDTGRGIREEDLPHIFERYYRVEKQPETPGCAGLGLAITKRILELHNSAITVQSTPGEGTTFAFSLPVHPPLSS